MPRKKNRTPLSQIIKASLKACTTRCKGFVVFYAARFRAVLLLYAPPWLRDFDLNDLIILAWALLVFLVGAYVSLLRIPRFPFLIWRLLFCFWHLLTGLGTTGSYQLYKGVEIPAAYLQRVDLIRTGCLKGIPPGNITTFDHHLVRKLYEDVRDQKYSDLDCTILASLDPAARALSYEYLCFSVLVSLGIHQYMRKPFDYTTAVILGAIPCTVLVPVVRLTHWWKFSKKTTFYEYFYSKSMSEDTPRGPTALLIITPLVVLVIVLFGAIKWAGKTSSSWACMKHRLARKPKKHDQGSSSRSKDDVETNLENGMRSVHKRMSTRLDPSDSDPAEGQDMPRPLRIIKREQQFISSPSVQVYHPRPASGPKLDVPRQRGTNTRLAPIRPLGTLGGSTVSHPTAREGVHGNSDSDRQSHNAARTTARVTTTGTLTHSNRLTSCGNASSNPLSPTTLSSNPPRRAFSSDISHLKRSRTDSLRLLSPQRQRTLSNLPSRLLSRVMNGVAGKTHVGHVAVEQEGTSSHGAVGNEAREASLQPNRSRSGTSSSVETALTFDYDLDVALAAFPTPPKSAATSPTTASSFEATHTTSPAVRTLVEPRSVAIPSAQLNVLTETNRLEADGGRSIVIAIEVIGAVASIEDAPRQASSLPIELDVAIVVDNSLFASPGALMANCEAARFLASRLDGTTDSLTVLCTSPIDANVKDPNVVSPLSRTSIRNIKQTVDSIMNSADKPEPAALGLALGRAIGLLTDRVNESSDCERNSQANGHVFVLTANPAGVPSLLLNHEKIQIHLVCPGAIPWKGSAGATCNGWKLAPLYSNALQYTSHQKDKDRDSLFNRLQSLLDLARTGKACGTLTDIVLEIEAGHGCSVEVVMGQREIASLRPGEIVTALVRVKVGAVFAKGYTLSRSPSSTNSTNSTKPQGDVLDELDVLLGASSTTILVAKLTYKHSLLPAGTRCSTIAAAKLKRSLPCSEEDTVIANAVNPTATNPRAAVQKRLVYHLATHQSPRKAISVLQEYFGVDGGISFCPQYVKLVADELRYQARIIERFDLPSSIKGGSSSLSNDMLHEHFGQGLFTMSNYKPQDWLTGLSVEESTSNASMKSQSGSSRRGPDLDTGIRKPVEVSRFNCRSSQTDVRKGKWIRDLAIRSKWSAGTDNSVGLQGPGSGKRRENIAPWSRTDS